MDGSDAGSGNPAPISSASFDDASRLLHTAALARAIDEPDASRRITPLLQGRFALRAHTVDVAVDTAVRDAAHGLLTHGWTPAEVHAFAAKRLDASALAYLVDALAATTQHTASAPWLPELTRLPARVWWTVGEPHVGQWAVRHGHRRSDAIQIAVRVLALLSYLPRTDTPSATARVALPGGALVQDERIAGKIDALLARAGSSSYPSEAAACARKAQELMVRYATVPDDALTTAGAAAALKRLRTENPITAVRTLLADALADLAERAAAALRPRPSRELTRPRRPLPISPAAHS
jgi:hypothetical protein